MLDKRDLEQITKIVGLQVNHLRDDLEDVETKIKGELSLSRIEMRKEFRELKDKLRKLEKGQLLMLKTFDNEYLELRNRVKVVEEALELS